MTAAKGVRRPKTRVSAAKKSKPRPSARTRPKKRAPLKPQSLLILHLDAEKLRTDGLHLGNAAAFSGLLSEVLLGSKVVIKNATTQAHLNQVLAELASESRTFNVVVVVAHSNATVIRVARDLVLPWDAFAGFLKPFKPRRLLLVACRGGRWDAGESLFRSMPLLRRIFACPVNASKDFGAMMLFAVPYVVAERRPKDKHVWWSQVATIAATGRQLREWRRTTDKGNRTAPCSTSWPILPTLWHGRSRRPLVPWWTRSVAAPRRRESGPRDQPSCRPSVDAAAFRRCRGTGGSRRAA